MNTIGRFLLASIFGFAVVNLPTHANDDKNETVENIKEGGRDLKKEAKKAGRKAKDETCEMVNGKMECAAKKVKHKAQNAGDEIKDKADDMKKD